MMPPAGFDGPMYLPVPDADDAPLVRAWFDEALVRWLHSEAMRLHLQPMYGPAALVRDLYHWFRARSRARWYLRAEWRTVPVRPFLDPGADGPDAMGTLPVGWPNNRVSTVFYPALWNDLQDALLHFDYGARREDTAAEDRAVRSLRQWLREERAGTLLSEGVPELPGHWLLSPTAWRRFQARRARARVLPRLSHGPDHPQTEEAMP